ncbi:MAG: hypothetical protein ACI4TT_04635, partial [Christensenellales bacterium]
MKNKIDEMLTTNDNYDSYKIFASYIAKKIGEKTKSAKNVNDILTLATMYYASKNNGQCWFENKYGIVVNGAKRNKDLLFCVDKDNAIKLVGAYENNEDMISLASGNKNFDVLPNSFKKTLNEVIEKTKDLSQSEIKNLCTYSGNIKIKTHKDADYPLSDIKYLNFND